MSKNYIEFYNNENNYKYTYAQNYGDVIHTVREISSRWYYPWNYYTTTCEVIVQFL